MLGVGFRVEAYEANLGSENTRSRDTEPGGAGRVITGLLQHMGGNVTLDKSGNKVRSKVENKSRTRGKVESEDKGKENLLYLLNRLAELLDESFENCKKQINESTARCLLGRGYSV